ncbi:hypothetical protein SNK03_011397 [Fusarium graminearum]
MFSESDPGPYLIVETHDSVRHCCSWSHTLAAPPLLTTDFAMSSGWVSIHSVPSDLSEKWQHVRRCGYELLESCPHITSDAPSQLKVKSGTPRHSLSMEHPDPFMSLEKLLTGMERKCRKAMTEQ